MSETNDNLEDDIKCIPHRSVNESSWCESELICGRSNDTSVIQIERSVSVDGCITNDETKQSVSLNENDSSSIDQCFIIISSAVEYKCIDLSATACKSSYFTEAERIAKVSFLEYKQLECDSNGQEYTNVEHDITIRIPKGAVLYHQVVSAKASHNNSKLRNDISYDFQTCQVKPVPQFALSPLSSLSSGSHTIICKWTLDI